MLNGMAESLMEIGVSKRMTLILLLGSNRRLFDSISIIISEIDYASSDNNIKNSLPTISLA